MSASRDKSQKVAFVYSNLYQIYRKGKEAALNSESLDALSPRGLTTAQVIKASSAEALDGSPVVIPKVRSYSPAELIGKRVARPISLPPKAMVAAPQNATLNSLKKNLQDLNDLHSRLKFMLKELEELSKE